jgi:hypothetical protein
MLYSYAQPCDPLVDAGWKIADVDEREPKSHGIERTETKLERRKKYMVHRILGSNSHG